LKRIVETDRLLVREFVVDDAAEFYAFNSDPEVMRYTGEPPTESLEQAREMIRNYPDYREHGYGRWAVVYKPDDRIVGFNGLKHLDDLGQVDLGYRFRADYWGLGIATESSVAIVRYGFETLDLERIIGLVLPQNAASIRVLAKVGMRHDGTIPYCGDQAQRWVIENPSRSS